MGSGKVYLCMNLGSVYRALLKLCPLVIALAPCTEHVLLLYSHKEKYFMAIFIMVGVSDTTPHIEIR